MTNEEAKVFLDNLKICINEHPIVADWLVEIADRKPEPTGYNLSPVDKDINVRSNSSEKPNNCEDCKHNKLEWYSEICDSCCGNNNHYEPKTEPQADGILFKGNLKEGDYKLIKTTNGWVLEGDDIAYYGEPKTDCPWK